MGYGCGCRVYDPGVTVLRGSTGADHTVSEGLEGAVGPGGEIELGEIVGLVYIIFIVWVIIGK